MERKERIKDGIFGSSKVKISINTDDTVEVTEDPNGLDFVTVIIKKGKKEWLLFEIGFFKREMKYLKLPSHLKKLQNCWFAGATEVSWEKEELVFSSLLQELERLINNKSKQMYLFPVTDYYYFPKYKIGRDRRIKIRRGYGNVNKKLIIFVHPRNKDVQNFFQRLKNFLLEKKIKQFAKIIDSLLAPSPSRLTQEQGIDSTIKLMKAPINKPILLKENLEKLAAYLDKQSRIAFIQVINNLSLNFTPDISNLTNPANKIHVAQTETDWFRKITFSLMSVTGNKKKKDGFFVFKLHFI